MLSCVCVVTRRSSPLMLNIAFHLQVRLVEEDPSYFTYGESYDIHCSRHGREADMPIVKFKQLCCTENGHLLNDPMGSRREAVSLVWQHQSCDLQFRSALEPC